LVDSSLLIANIEAGKSTLIKMLIDSRECATDPNAEPQYPSPIVGSPHNDGTPTSADVHLYPDPDTFHGQKPMLYADCEGLDAGEEAPFGLASRRGLLKKERKKLVARIAGGYVRPRRLEWANTDVKQTRHFAVRELYPRLLYTFSDVVVFVLRNTA
jgi:hypothetical protein